MRRLSLVLIGIGVQLLSLRAIAIADEKPIERPFQISIRILERTGSKTSEDAAVKVLAEPVIITHGNRPFHFFSGGEVPAPGGTDVVEFGTEVRGKLLSAADGHVRADLYVGISTLVDHSDDSFRLDSQSSRFVTTLQLGKTVKFAPRRVHDRWIEVTVSDATK